MPKKLYHVKLTSQERMYLEGMINSGTEKARKLTHARILLKADLGWSDEEISEAVEVHALTVSRIRQRFAQEGLKASLNRRSTSRVYERKVDGRVEAHLIALVCSQPPEGKRRWSMRLLAEELVTLEELEVGSISRETIRRALKKMNLSPGRTSNG